MKKILKVVVLGYVRLYMIMVVTHYYLERENYKVLKFHVNNYSYFEMNTSLFLSAAFQ